MANKKQSKAAEAVAQAKTADVADAVQTAPVEPVNLTIADLQNLAVVVDAAFKRGAFGAAEASNVGAVYTKLATFLEQVAAQSKDAETKESAPAAE